MSTEAANYLSARGFRETTPEALNKALRVVLDSMEASAYGDATTGLSAEEQAVLKESGLTLEPTPGPDPLAETAVKFAAIIERSLTSKETSERLGLAGSRIRQMIADRSLYSFLVDRTRYIPNFQFERKKNRLVPNIGRINRALSPGLHPVEVYNWLHYPHVDLYLNDDMDQTVSPLEWLRSGKDPEVVELLARRL